MPPSVRARTPLRCLRKLAGILLTLGIGVSVLVFSGLTLTLDRWLFDNLSQLQAFRPVSTEEILVVRSPFEPSPEVLSEVAAECRRSGARLTLLPGEAAREAGLRNGNGLFLIPVSDPGRGASAEGVRRGTGRSNPVAAALSALSPEKTVPDAFRFDFRVPSHGIPLVEMRRLLEGDVPARLIEDRVVLVGRDSLYDRLIVTPVHRGGDSLSPLFFNALVADAVLRPGLVRVVPETWSRGFGFGLALILGCILCRRNYRSSLRISFAAAALLFLAAAGSLVFAHLWLSPVAPLVLVSGVGMVSARQRMKVERSSLLSTLRNLAVETRERARKTALSHSGSPWPMVERVLRGAFASSNGFVLVHSGRGELVPATAEGEELLEKRFVETGLRMDCEPFASALREGMATTGTHGVVIPIRTPARLFGFWTFESGDFRNVGEAEAYAGRVAGFLQRRESENEALGMFGSKLLHEQLSASIDLLEDGRRVLADALDCSREAVLVFDPLGFSDYVSRPTAELLSSAGIEYLGVRPPELLAELSNAGPREIGRALRALALNGESVTLTARKDLAPGREFFLHLRPLNCGAPGDRGEELPGLVVLIEDVTRIARGVLLKDDFMERFHFQLNNDFESILAATELLDDPRLPEADRDELITLISEKVKEATGRLGETRALLQREFTPEIVERFPVRFSPLLKAAWARVEGEAAARQLELEVSVSDYLPLVLASPGRLEEILQTMLVTLIRDSKENTVIGLTVNHDEGRLSLLLRNDGFGLPQDQLDGLLEKSAGGPESLERLGLARKTVEAWEGRFSARSKVGRGLELSLDLAAVL